MANKAEGIINSVSFNNISQDNLNKIAESTYHENEISNSREHIKNLKNEIYIFENENKSFEVEENINMLDPLKQIKILNNNECIKERKLEIQLEETKIILCEASVGSFANQDSSKIYTI